MAIINQSNISNALFGGLGQRLAAQQQAQGLQIQAGGTSALRTHYDVARARIVRPQGMYSPKKHLRSLREELQTDVDNWLPKL